jgi:phosphoribosylformylglycinamidine synthase
MKVAVIVFPGTNCDQDIVHVYRKLLRVKVDLLWHRDTSLGKPDLVILPGGFSYGDYLRTGALAKVSPIMTAVRDFVKRGGNVLGICNGFQILCEAGLLPGGLLRNIDQRFLSQFVNIRVENSRSFFTSGLPVGQVITCPIAHGEGNYLVSEEELQELESEGQVVLRYCDSAGRVDAGDRSLNPNGSVAAIAGISNREGTVVGLMPHPERAVELLTGSIGGASGRALFEATRLALAPKAPAL